MGRFFLKKFEVAANARIILEIFRGEEGEGARNRPQGFETLNPTACLKPSCLSIYGPVLSELDW